MTIAFIFCSPYNIELGSHLGAWAVFFCWMNTTQLLGRFEFFGVGIFMALHVAKKIIITFVVFSLEQQSLSTCFLNWLKQEEIKYTESKRVAKVKPGEN